MKNIKTLISTITLVGIITLLLFQSCNKDALQFADETSNPMAMGSGKPPIFYENEGLMVLGEQLEDPYNIANMRQALSNLKLAGNIVIPIKTIMPNMVYLRFLPNDEDEWNELRMDTTLLFFDHPLDYEIEMSGAYYHDPSLPEDAITWQYTVLPINYSIPNIQHEILYELFFPPTESLPTPKNLDPTYIFYEELLTESLVLTGNYDPNMSKGKWTPSGSIHVYDHVLDDYIPLRGAKVVVNFLTRFNDAITNDNGNFDIGKTYNNKVNYKIKWERGQYDIRNGNFGQATTDGPNQKSAWHKTIYAGGKTIMYATIHRAAHKFFYGDRLGIKSPELAIGKTKICYLDKEGDNLGMYWSVWNVFGVLPNIQIWGKSNGVYRRTELVFGTTIHELAHQSHNRYVGNIQFWQTDDLIAESWARAVQWALTNHEYHALGNKHNHTGAKNYNHEGGYQTWQRTWTNWKYSPLFIDLIDNYNQRGMSNLFVTFNSIVVGPPISIFPIAPYCPTCPNDRIFGYTLKQIQDIVLKNSKNLSDFKKEAKKLPGVKAVDVDELTALY
jgi:hypothetical protein